MSGDPIVHFMRLLHGMAVLLLFVFAMTIIAIVVRALNTSPVFVVLTFVVTVIAIAVSYLVGYALTEEVTEGYV